eukprot:10444049-Lingulodinium_polyedra.AAC.1
MGKAGGDARAPTPASSVGSQGREEPKGSRRRASRTPPPKAATSTDVGPEEASRATHRQVFMGVSPPPPR